MVTFILNNQLVRTDMPTGTPLVDYIRYEKDLMGTKIGCREGDCGACTVLEGDLVNGRVHYKSIVSCLTPLGNVNGKHIVTIEGISMNSLSPIQHSFVKHAATQCGFCTPGFIMSLTGHSLQYDRSTPAKAIASISGNICRCTGYKSIEQAAGEISVLLSGKDLIDPIGWLVEHRFLPLYFLDIPARLADLKERVEPPPSDGPMVAGGTDLMVQRADEIADLQVNSLVSRHELKGISIADGMCCIGAATTFSEFEQSEVVNGIIPRIKDYLSYVSSETIRNMGTIAGNIVNASPIGDLTIMLLALDAVVTISNGDAQRQVPLKNFYLGYKSIDLRRETGEYIARVSFPVLSRNALFSFEKVSKRTHLDIASVNTALVVEMVGKVVVSCRLSAGGVNPIPLYLHNTSRFLEGKTLNEDLLTKANLVMQDEIAPISDIRGSEGYKRLLLRQLLYAHFLKLFPSNLDANRLLAVPC
jgi:xanthine dehydrogenase small subunit